MEKLDVESMKKLKNNVDKCLAELTKKNDITPAETRAALDGFELRDRLCYEMECEDEEEKPMEKRAAASYGYSGHEMPYRRYNITAYGRPMEYQSSPEYEARMSHRDMYSGDYGIRGWYNSNSNGMRNSYHEPWMGDRYDPYYMGRGDESYRYSRHSVADRIVSLIEHDVMGGASSDYEKDEAKRYIHMIRQAEAE